MSARQFKILPFSKVPLNKQFRFNGVWWESSDWSVLAAVSLGPNREFIPNNYQMREFKYTEIVAVEVED